MAQRRARGRAREKLVDLHAARIARPRLERLQDQQGNQDGPAPIRNPRQVERKPPRQKHDFDRNNRHGRPGDHAKQRQEDAREDVGRARTAVGQNGLARAQHVRCVGRIAGELERQVRFDARADIEPAAVKQRPSAVGTLQAAQIDCDLGLEGRVALAEEVLQDDVLGRNGGVGLQLEHPMPVRAPEFQQCRAGRLDCALEARPGGVTVHLARNDLDVQRQLRLSR